MLEHLQRLIGRQPIPSPASRVVTVYSRAGCHLCDDAVQLLREHGLRPEIVDVDQDLQLQARFTHCVPVVVIDGRERFRGRVDRRLLRRLLRRA